MSLTVTQRPSTTISGNTSKWNAAKNPIVYKMQRKDYATSFISNSAGKIVVQFAGVDLRSVFPVGSKGYLKSDNGVYDLQISVFDVQFSVGDTYVICNEAYISVTLNGFMNAFTRSNYRVQVGVYNTENNLLGTVSYSPDKSGNLVIDVSTPLKNTLSVDNVADYVTGFTTNDETTAYVKFYIRYRELWLNSNESETNDTANQFFALYGARQIGELYGGNLAEYVNYENATPLAQFLTKFTLPSIWRGYPFSISTITSDNVSTNSNFRVEYFDATGTTISNNVVTKAANAGKLIRFSPNNALAIPSNAVTAQIRYEKTGIVVLSQTITCDIKDPCSNPIHLYWRNSLDGDAFWMFDFNQNYSYRYDNGRKAERYVLFASNLTDNEFDAISELNTLGEVYEPAYTELTTSVNKSQARIGAQVYMMDATGKKTGVIVIPTEVSTKTKFSRNKIQITIELPEIY